MNQWHLLYKTRNYTRASILQGMLEENHIPVQILNKLDGIYQYFDEIELYVPVLLKEVAKSLLNQSLLN